MTLNLHIYLAIFNFGIKEQLGRYSCYRITYLASLDSDGCPRGIERDVDKESLYRTLTVRKAREFKMTRRLGHHVALLFVKLTIV